jgi:hypothetical protein
MLFKQYYVKFWIWGVPSLTKENIIIVYIVTDFIILYFSALCSLRNKVDLKTYNNLLQIWTESFIIFIVI